MEDTTCRFVLQLPDAVLSYILSNLHGLCSGGSVLASCRTLRDPCGHEVLCEHVFGEIWQKKIIAPCHSSLFGSQTGLATSAKLYALSHGPGIFICPICEQGGAALEVLGWHCNVFLATLQAQHQPGLP
mmetsp:Transcript_29529/g.97762  ORF Transcript_29529/g.97762 Transcript_29529/m.97762 type:complete len:129 (+) Transcript_29529:84-470(+)